MSGSPKVSDHLAEIFNRASEFRVPMESLQRREAWRSKNVRKYRLEACWQKMFMPIPGTRNRIFPEKTRQTANENAMRADYEIAQLAHQPRDLGPSAVTESFAKGDSRGC